MGSEILEMILLWSGGFLFYICIEYEYFIYTLQMSIHGMNTDGMNYNWCFKSVLDDFLVTDMYCTFYKPLYLGINAFLLKFSCQNI